MTSPDPRSLTAASVAIIGAGPAGLVTARWLLARGLDPVLFEAAGAPGGQWNSAAPLAATWRGMRTNTSRVLTAFSDLDHPDDTPVYPRQEEMHAYLLRYAEQSGLAGRIRLRAPVEQVTPAGEGYRVTFRQDGRRHDAFFSRVVVASGRHVAPCVPDIPGLDSFTGALGASHTAQYDGGVPYRDRDVLVAGCSVSALEIASDLAASGARSVTAAYRRQRYILPKIMAGVPTDHVMFTRAAALAGAVLPPDALAEGLREKVVAAAGTPEQYGAGPADRNIFLAGLSQSQSFLPHVAEGRIRIRPWIERIAGRTVRFADGRETTVDAILFGTGYRLSLPFLPEAITARLGLDDTRIDLCDHTFHPDLPGLAFVGLYDLVGPAFPVLELQARWLAGIWGGTAPAPTQEALRDGLARARAGREGPRSVLMPDMALLFARHAGVEPDPAAWPELERALLFGPLSPASFRLAGPDSLSGAPGRTAAAAAAFGAIPTPEFTEAERGLRNLLRTSAPVPADA